MDQAYAVKEKAAVGTVILINELKASVTAANQ